MENNEEYTLLQSIESLGPRDFNFFQITPTHFSHYDTKMEVLVGCLPT